MSHPGAQGSNTVGQGTARGGIQIKIVPKVGRIAVVRMDPVDMVSRLNLDDIARAQARALQTRKYLVYLDYPQDIPHPDRDWCRYRVSPIATTLRAVSIKDGLAETMVHPIYPNKYAYKAPVRSSPILPFPNCYFWFRSSMSLRVRVKRGEDWYDNDNSIEIPIPEILKLDWRYDVPNMYALLELNSRSNRKRGSPILSIGPPLPPPLRTYTPSLDVSRGGNESAPQATDLSRSHTATDVENALRSPRSSSHLPTTSSLPPQAHESSDLLQDCLNFNLLGWEEDPTFKFIPLVDLWFDLKEHLSSESIPSPVDLWMEQERIGIIIEDGLRRRAAEQAVARSSIPHATPRVSPPSLASSREKRTRTESMEYPSGRSQSQLPQNPAKTSRDVRRSSQAFDSDIETMSVVSTCSESGDARMAIPPQRQRSWASLLSDPSETQRTAARPAVWPALQSRLVQKALQDLSPSALLRRSSSQESHSRPKDTDRAEEPEPQPRSLRQGESSRGRASGRGGRGRHRSSRRRGRGAPVP